MWRAIRNLCEGRVDSFRTEGIREGLREGPDEDFWARALNGVRNPRDKAVVSEKDWTAARRILATVNVLRTPQRLFSSLALSDQRSNSLAAEERFEDIEHLAFGVVSGNLDLDSWPQQVGVGADLFRVKLIDGRPTPILAIIVLGNTGEPIPQLNGVFPRRLTSLNACQPPDGT